MDNEDKENEQNSGNTAGNDSNNFMNTDIAMDGDETGGNNDNPLINSNDNITSNEELAMVDGNETNNDNLMERNDDDILDTTTFTPGHENDPQSLIGGYANQNNDTNNQLDQVLIDTMHGHKRKESREQFLNENLGIIL